MAQKYINSHLTLSLAEKILAPLGQHDHKEEMQALEDQLTEVRQEAAQKDNQITQLREEAAQHAQLTVLKDNQIQQLKEEKEMLNNQVNKKERQIQDKQKQIATHLVLLTEKDNETQNLKRAEVKALFQQAEAKSKEVANIFADLRSWDKKCREEVRKNPFSKYKTVYGDNLQERWNKNRKVEKRGYISDNTYDKMKAKLDKSRASLEEISKIGVKMDSLKWRISEKIGAHGT